jgi:Protein of unknown function (DUF1579)
MRKTFRGRWKTSKSDFLIYSSIRAISKHHFLQKKVLIKGRRIKMLQAIDIKLQFQGQPLAQPLGTRIAPSPECRNLHLFVGKWNTEGETRASEDTPATKVAFVDTYEWLPGKFFLVHRADGQIGNEELSTIEFIGYDASSQMYSCHSFDSHGNADLFQANLRDRTWTIEGESARFTGLFSNTGNILTGQWEQSSDGLNWLPWMDVKLTKIS